MPLRAGNRLCAKSFAHKRIFVNWQLC